MGKAATLGFCPYCKTALNPGATACTGCSAFETTEWKEGVGWKIALFALLFLVGPLMSVPFFYLSPILGLIFLVGLPVSFFLIRSRKNRKITWVVSGGRFV